MDKEVKNDELFSQDQLKKLKIYFDSQSESQDDVLESERWVQKVDWNDDVVEKSVIIWSMDRYSGEENQDENCYTIKVEFRYYDKEGEVTCEDEVIDSYDLSIGYLRLDLEVLGKSINAFICNGGTKKDLDHLMQ